MELTCESLLSFQGIEDMHGLAHVRVYEAAGQMPVAMAGQLDDNPGTHITVGIEMVAASIHEHLFSDGREFRLITYEPSDMLGNAWVRLVEFEHRTVTENPSDPSHYTGALLIVNSAGEQLLAASGPKKRGDFRDPKWTAIDDPEQIVGCEVQTWPKGEYTAEAVFGAEGAAVQAKLAANARAMSDRFLDLLRP